MYLGSLEGTYRVSAAGGALEPLTTINSGPSTAGRHDWPQLLPDGKSVLFLVKTTSGGKPAILSLDTKQWRFVEGAPLSDYVAFVATGHLITVNGRQIAASQMDLTTGKTVGAAVPVVEDFGGIARMMLLSVSATGSLIYASTEYLALDGALVWVDRRGNESPIAELATGFINAQHRLSPDNRWVASVKQGLAHEGIWKYDLAGNGRQRLTTFGGYLPTWRPDGAGIAFARTHENRWAIFWAPAAGETKPQLLLGGATNHWPVSWSADGRYLAFREYLDSGTPSDIHTFGSDGAVTPFLSTGFDEREPEFAPKGNWMAFVSNESGTDEVYVSQFPSGDQKRKISSGGGKHPAWSAAGDELFYLSGNRMMAVKISIGTSLAAGTPQLLFEGRYLPATVDVRNYDVSRDGKRFLMVKEVGAAKVQLSLVTNWFEELKRLNTGSQ